MKQIAVLVLLGLAVAALGGCNTLGRQPHLGRVMVVPDVLQPDESALITVDVRDPNNVVEELIGVVEGYEDAFQFPLRDDGEPPDVKADDGIWTYMVDAHYQAPPGQFTIRITAYDDLGRAVVVKTREGKGPLSTTVPVTIEYPADAMLPVPPPTVEAPVPVPPPVPVPEPDEPPAIEEPLEE